MSEPPLRLDELGSVQFERFCAELLDVPREPLDSRPWGTLLLLPHGVDVPGGGALAGPTLVVAAWLRDAGRDAAALARLRAIVEDTRRERPGEPRSLLLLTNVPGADAAVPAGLAAAVLGPAELWALVRARRELRYRVPSLLGVCDLDALVPAEAAKSSTADVAAAAELARVFVPTRAYVHALAVLRRHRFAVLTGPPEMGKTAIARTIGLAALADGWELHECIRPEELWQRFARGRAQLFVADDAFGSTEYRPDAAERWALELDRVLRALDERHWLIWTSRPAPLKAGLRRVHREHGVERWPQPAEIGVDAAGLDVREKALILFRHARAAELPADAVRLVRGHGWQIVSHEHFTPERIRRFVGGRLRELAASPAPRLPAAVAAEIREPTAAMAASYRSLAPDHRAVLLALLDTPPGPVPERELASAVRRHSPTGLPRPAAEVVDRLADHFLRVTAGGAVTWVHPSWRDLVVEELAADGAARRRFLRACGVHGVVLALSTGGGAAGERALPLLREDADWDALADRLARLEPALDGPGVTLLLTALADVLEQAEGAAGVEAAALAGEALSRLARAWRDDRGAVPVGLLAAYFALAARLPDAPPPPETVLATAWFELLPSGLPRLSDRAAVTAFDDWLALAELLAAHAPETLRGLGFPDERLDLLRDLVATALTAPQAEPAQQAAVARLLRRLADAVPELRGDALAAAYELARSAPPPPAEPEPRLRELSPELERLLELPFGSERTEEALVARVLRDL